MAEAVFQRMVDHAGLSDRIQVDSAGTSAYHVGEPAHPGTRRVLTRHGITYERRARQLRAEDALDDHTYLIAMDGSNAEELRARFGDQANIHRLLEFAVNTPVRDVPDPYYSDNFDYVYRLVDDGCRGLLAAIRANEGI
jgi:protein-tyrosine phosphatase